MIRRTIGHRAFSTWCSAQEVARCRLLLAFALAVVVLALLPSPGHAHKRDFAWSYDWFIPYLGEKEVEIWYTSKDGEHHDTWIEYEFAVTPGWAVGLYATRSEGADGGMDFDGWKWENRYRFGEYDFKRWLHAAYLELKKERGEPYELEGKWILSRYTMGDESLAANLTAERELASGADLEWKVSAGWSRAAAPRWRAGAEIIAELTDHEWYVGPTATYDPTHSTRIVVGAAFGLTPDSHDVMFRAIGEYEW
jgi:hypothetical protein